jgi:hypothetical protein
MANFADLPVGAKYRIVSTRSKGQVYTKVKYRDHANHADVHYAYADDLFQIFAAPGAASVVERCQELEVATKKVADEVIAPRPVAEKLGVDNK